MSRVMRNRNRISYYEPEEPSFDDYVFCSSCGDYVYEYCSIHGPLLVIPDDEVPSPTGYPTFVPRAALTIPRAFLHLAPSTIPDAGIGVFSTLTLPKGVRFGPYRGLKTDGVNSSYCWQIYDHNRKTSHVLDARNPNKSNWMRYVNCSRHFSEQNLLAFQYQGQLYYRTIKIIPRFTELLVFYGSEFASELNIDLRRYHSPAYSETLVECETESIEPDTNMLETQLSKDKENVFPNLESQELSSKINSENEQNFSEDKSSINKLKQLKKENINSNDNKNDNCDPRNEKLFNDDQVMQSITNIATNIDNKLNRYSCSICATAFATKSELINHNIKVHHSQKVYKSCTSCDYKTDINRDLQKHIKTHKTQKYICDTCQYETKYVSFIERHIKKHEPTCSICKQTFKKRAHLRRHLKTHEQKSYDCKICNLKFIIKSEYLSHIKCHEESNITCKATLNTKRHVCEICSDEFRKTYDYMRHMSLHSAQRHQCNICSYSFSNRYGLRRHMITHSEDKPYKCSLCNFSSHLTYSLKRHMKVHLVKKDILVTKVS